MKVHANFCGAFGNVRSQGKRMTCLSFATSSAHRHKIATADELSVEFLYYHSVQVMPGQNPDVGTTIDSTALAISQAGQPAEVHWPYEPVQLYGAAWLPPSLPMPTNKAALKRCDANFDTIIKEIDRGVPVILGLVITDAFFVCRPDGKLPILSPDIKRSGHAVLAVGHASDSDGRYLLVRNSWGNAWGAGGHAWLSEHYLGLHLAEVAIVV